MTFLEAMRAVRDHVWRVKADDLLPALGRLQHLASENNHLRHANERLTQENARLAAELGQAWAAHRTAATMAEAYRIEARGGDYDETTEDAP